MSDLASKLKYAAIDVVNSIQGRRHKLEADLKKAQFHILEIQATLDATKLAINRFNSFTPDIGGNLQCPRCWIVSGRHVAMRTATGDGFDCGECQFEFSSD